MHEQATLSRRALAALPIAALAGASRPASATVPAQAGTDDAELLDLGRLWLALHNEHVAHWRAWQALPEAESELRREALEAECEAMSHREWAIEARIHAIPATTIAGLAVKARIAAHEFDVEKLDAVSIDDALNSAAYDAALLQMGQEWSACRLRLSRHQDHFGTVMVQAEGDERRKLYETFAAAETALYDELFGIEGRIIATPARTLAGLQLKCRVVAREHDDSRGTDLTSIERMLDDPEVTEGRAGLSLAADILRLGRIA